LIHPQVTRGITLGLAAVTAAVSAAMAQVHPVWPDLASQPAAAPVLASDRIQVLPRLDVETSQGALAAAQATQLAAQPAAGAPEVARVAPALPGRSTPQAPAAPRPVGATAAAATAAAPPPPANVPAGSVQDIIVAAFTPYGPAAVQWGLRVARCESGYNPRALNPAGPYYGLFQFLMSTFRNTPYGGQDIFDPVANASAAAWKYGHGGSGAWGCR
jgi:hypothetical protein